MKVAERKFARLEVGVAVSIEQLFTPMLPGKFLRKNLFMLVCVPTYVKHCIL